MALKRQEYSMPDFIKNALENERLLEKYNRRPPYQRNDYIGWVIRAKRQETIDKRLRQMLAELEQGDRYMGMVYKEKCRRNAT